MTLIVKCLSFFGNKYSFRINGKESGMLSIHLILIRNFNK